MTRRNFVNNISLSLFSLGWVSHSFKSISGLTENVARKRLLPIRLKPGDTIGLITPGSYISDESLEKAIKNLEELGFRIKPGKHLRAKRGFNAGTDAQRLEDLHAMFADPDVDGIWCARGGYGCTRLLPYIDFKLIRKNPKVFIGYSDITALLNAIYPETGLVCFHGPVASSDFTEYTVQCLRKVLMGPDAPLEIHLPELNLAKEDGVFKPFVITPGTASGQLIGGNLSILASLAGTPHSPDFKNKIVCIEEIGEKPYRIDRMLTQLRQATNLSRAAGIALGIFKDCEPEPDDDSLTLKETLTDRLSGLGVPALYGLPFGHVGNQCTWPIGVEGKLMVFQQKLMITERAVK